MKNSLANIEVNLNVSSSFVAMFEDNLEYLLLLLYLCYKLLKSV